MADHRPAGESSRTSSSFVNSGDRQMFTVELRPGETTIISWKKLVKDANRVNGASISAGAGAVPAPEMPPNVNPRLESRIAPMKQAGEEAKDEPPANRLNAVIQKIESLYTKDSSDEDLGDAPDDDQYDTEDSFIDDAELDEYFQVDNSAIKHDGFFVNRGKLERIEPAALPDQQPKKKRRRKDFTKGNGEKDDGHLPNKQRKSGTTAKSLSTSAQGVAVSEPKDINKQKAGVISPKDPNKKSKVLPQSFDSSHPKHRDKSTQAQPRLQSSRPFGIDELESSVRGKEKNGVREHTDVNIFEGKVSATMTKSPHLQKRDGSSIRPRSSMLDKSIRELERVVAESRPPADNLEADNSAQAIKRRLPREVKMKLGKVARLAQASHGKVSKELLNRLMSILGHIIQLRTLKRNLKVMINMSLSDKQEQHDRFQYIKKEVVDMIKLRAPSLELKADQQAGSSDNIQETISEAKDVSKKKINLDAPLEDKICDLYDLYVDQGLDEDSGTQVRKLYIELAQLWPNGIMDNHGIKRAICRAKERRRAIHRSKAQYSRDRLAAESSGQSSANKLVSSMSASVQMPSPLNAPTFDKPKHERSKGSSGNSTDDAKKKVKRKPETESDGARVRLERLTSQQGEERANKPTKPGILTNGVPSVDQSVKLT